MHETGAAEIMFILFLWPFLLKERKIGVIVQFLLCANGRVWVSCEIWDVIKE